MHWFVRTRPLWLKDAKSSRWFKLLWMWMKQKMQQTEALNSQTLSVDHLKRRIFYRIQSGKVLSMCYLKSFLGQTNGFPCFSQLHILYIIVGLWSFTVKQCLHVISQIVSFEEFLEAWKGISSTSQDGKKSNLEKFIANQKLYILKKNDC